MILLVSFDTISVKIEKNVYFKVYVINNYDFEIKEIKLSLFHPDFRINIEPPKIKNLQPLKQSSFKVSLFYRPPLIKSSNFSLKPIFEFKTASFRENRELRLILIDGQTEF